MTLCNYKTNYKHIHEETVIRLTNMLDEHNIHTKSFHTARDKLRNKSVYDLNLRLMSNRSHDERIYNIPHVFEVVALILGDFDFPSKKDIILETHTGKLQRINELHTSYLAYQYPLLFPYGEDEYRHGVLHRVEGCFNGTNKNKLTVREWLCFRIQSRENEAHTLFRSRRLFQQFLVDGYTMVESERLAFIRMNQSKLRVGKHDNLNHTSNNDAERQGSNKGERVILPSSFVCGRRYMDQLYFDAM